MWPMCLPLSAISSSSVLKSVRLWSMRTWSISFRTVAYPSTHFKSFIHLVHVGYGASKKSIGRLCLCMIVSNSLLKYTRLDLMKTDWKIPVIKFVGSSRMHDFCHASHLVNDILSWLVRRLSISRDVLHIFRQTCSKNQNKMKVVIPSTPCRDKTCFFRPSMMSFAFLDMIFEGKGHEIDTCKPTIYYINIFIWFYAIFDVKIT